jgi:hypothetical protein
VPTTASNVISPFNWVLSVNDTDFPIPKPLKICLNTWTHDPTVFEPEKKKQYANKEIELKYIDKF